LTALSETLAPAGAKFITNPGNGKVFQAKVFNNIATGVAGRKIGFEISF